MKPITIQDYDIVNKYLELASYPGYNSNFNTFIMWNHEYQSFYEVHDHYMVVLYNHHGHYMWCAPFTTPQYFKDALSYMINYSDEHHFEFSIIGAASPFVSYIKNLYKDQLLYKRTPEYDDYIYDKNKLMTLSGKKLQKKRNHYNAFIRNYPDYEYRDLKKEDIPEILEFLEFWRKQKNEEVSLDIEVQGVKNMLELYDSLDYVLAGIYIENKLQAFIIASSINHEYVQIHVEKANRNIRGLYITLLRDMLNHHFPDEQYVDREDDTGLENLRKSKQSMHPIFMVEKTYITLNKEIITKADENDLEEIRELWLESFDDEDLTTTNFYFEYEYDKNYTYLLKNNNEIITMLQIRPIPICLNNKLEEDYFIVGVCTREAYQRKGYMRKLLDYVLDQYNDATIYLQAYNPEVYKDFGFTFSHYIKRCLIDQCKTDQIDSIIKDKHYDLLLSLYNQYTSNFEEFCVRDIEYYKRLYKRCKAYNQEIEIYKYNDDYDGYTITYMDDHLLRCNEIIYKDDDSLNRILSTLLNKYDKISIDTNLRCPYQGNITGILMSNKPNSIEYIDKYINEIY